MSEVGKIQAAIQLSEATLLPNQETDIWHDATGKLIAAMSITPKTPSIVVRASTDSKLPEHVGEGGFNLELRQDVTTFVAGRRIVLVNKGKAPSKVSWRIELITQ